MMSVGVLVLLGAPLVGCGVDDSGGVFYVNSATGNNSNSGRSPGSAFKTVTHALNFARGGAQIVIAEGVYSAATGETFPLKASEEISAISGAGPSLTTLLDDTEGEGAVLGSSGPKEIRGLTLKRESQRSCDSCSGMSLSVRSGGKVVLADLAFVVAQPNAWALRSEGDRDAERASIGTVEARSLVVDGKGVGRGLAFFRFGAATLATTTIQAVVTPALFVYDVASFDGSELTMGAAQTGRDPETGGNAASIKFSKDSNTGRATLRDVTMTFAPPMDAAFPLGIEQKFGTELVLERARLDLSAVPRGAGLRSSAPAQLRGVVILGGRTGGAFSRGLVMRDSTLQGQSRVGIIISSPHPDTAYDLGTEADPGHNKFATAGAALADLALERGTDIRFTRPVNVPAVGNVWSDLRTTCYAAVEFSDAPAGKHQIVVETAAGAVMHAPGQSCKP
jgi:hypothetical protein